MSSPKTPLRTEILLELLGVIVLIAFLGSELNLLRDPGVGWHLRTGEWIARAHTVPSADPFLFTSLGKEWICNQWLADLLLWGTYSFGGLATVEVGALLLCMLPFLLLTPERLRHFGASAPAMLLTLLVCMGLGLVQWYVRPVIFSFLFFAILYRILWKRCQHLNWRLRDFFLIPALFLVWANLHPGFPLGLALLGIAVFDSAIRLGVRCETTAKVFGILALSIAATVINPYGLTLHRSIFGLVSSDYFMGLNAEWQSPNFHNPVFWPLAATIFLCLTAPKRDPELLPFEKAAFGIFTVFALMGGRYVPFLGVAAATPLVCAFQGYFDFLHRFRGISPLTAFLDGAERVGFKVGVPTAILGALLLIFTAATHSIPGWKPEAQSVDAKIPAEVIEILKVAPENSRVFHTPNWGGYFTWAIWPRQKAFIDDRNELNGKDLYEDFFTIVRLRKDWKATIEKYRFDFLLLEKETPIYSAIKSGEEWSNRFEDEGTALFERKSSLPAASP